MNEIAIYGAVTGTIGSLTGAWGIWHSIVRDRSRFRMRITMGKINSYPGIDSTKMLWFVALMNYGKRRMTFSSLPGFEFEDGMRFVLTPLEYLKGPQTIEEGQSVTYWMYEDALVESLREEERFPVRVMVTDDAGNTHRWKIDRHALATWKRLVDQASKGTP